MVKKILIGLILFSGFINCQNYKSHYNLKEIEGYTKISIENYRFLSNKLGYPSKNYLPPIPFEYLFQKNPLDTLFEYPFIAVYNKEFGRLTESNIRELIRNRFVLDSKTYYLWQELKDGWDIIVPTSYGTINIYFRTNNKKSASEIESLRKFVSSIELSADTKYKSGGLRDIPTLNRFFYQGRYIQVLLIMGIILVIYLSHRKRKKEIS